MLKYFSSRYADSLMCIVFFFLNINYAMENDRRKLLIFHPALAPYRVDQFNLLSRLFDLHVVFLFEDVPYDSFDQNKLIYRLTCSYSYLLRGPSFKGRIFRFGILKTIRKICPDIIIGYEFSPITLYLNFLKSIGLYRGILGTTNDDSLQICEDLKSGLRKCSRDYLCRKLDFIVVLSDSVSDFYKNRYGLHDFQLIVNPILQDEESILSCLGLKIEIAKSYIDRYNLLGKKVILYVGRLVKEKGLLLFIRTIADCLKNREDFSLVVVGAGPMKVEIAEFVDQESLNNIHLVGRVEGHDLIGWYLASSGFVLPSVYEPFGAVVNEALLCGLPVLCSTFVGSATLLNDRNGIIFDPTDAKNVRRVFEEFGHKINSVEYDGIVKKSLMDYDMVTINSEWSKLTLLKGECLS